MKSVVKAIIAGAVASFALGAAALAQAPATEGNLVVYASHPSEMVDHFTKMFGDKYGIRVTTVKAGTGELLNRIRAERNRPAADIMWGGFSDTGASAPDLFDKYSSPELANIEPKMPGREDQDHRRPALADRVDEPQAVHRAGWHVDVREDHADVGARLKELDGLVGVCRFDDVVAGVLNRGRSVHPDQRLILHD